MTDPLDDYPLPSSYIFVKPENSTAFRSYLRLPQNGVHTLIISTDYAPGLQVRISPLQDFTTQRQIGEMPAGTGMRSIAIPGVGVNATESQFLTIAATSQVSGADHRCTLQIITTPLTP